MTEELASLPLHAAWQTYLNEMVESGIEPIEAVESMITVAVAAKQQLAGTRAAAASLGVVAGVFAQQADREDAARRAAH